MTPEMKQWLIEQQEGVKADYALVEITPRQFSRFGGDRDYAETELVELLQGCGVWDGATDYDEIVSHPIFQKSIRWQAAYNRYT